MTHVSNRLRRSHWSFGWSLAVGLAVSACGDSTDTASSSSTTTSRGSAGEGSGSGASSGSVGPGSGGSSAASTGSGLGGMPLNPQPCDEAPVGEWQKIGPDNRTSHGLVVDPINTGTVYMGAGKADDFFTPAGVWKTNDCGATWTAIATGPGSELVNNGRQWTWLIDPFNSGVVYTTSGYGSNGFYKSIDGGVSWTDVTPKGDGAPGFVGGPAQMDPANPNHLLLTWHAPCGAYEDHIGCFAESKDGGATWKEHYGNPSWGEEVRVYVLHDNTWIITHDGLTRTDDGGATWTKVSDQTAGGHSSGNLYRSTTGAYYIGAGNGIARSTDDGLSWSLAPAGSYVMGLTSDGTTMYAGVAHGLMTSPESDGVNWTLIDSPFGDVIEGCFLDYDRDHDFLYASCHGGSYPNGTNGLWRMKTK
jgi:photosystem II stability/assembly factor-like uncharacterized protein